MSDFKLRNLIQKKRDGYELDPEDIKYLVESVTKIVTGDSDAPDRCQIGAMLMALYLKGISDAEVSELTIRMRDSGRVFRWPEELRPRMVDKHSTGGVGDKISLVLVPALAASGLMVPMISGRSLGHTGGTLDKLEAVRGCTVGLSDAEIRGCITGPGPGCCIAGQTADCVPADKILYECRDRTATVDCPPLIIASIASKKLSENLGALVYDVKFGKGSIFKTPEEALETAKGLVKASGGSVASVALLTSMEAPIGRAIGDALEVLEAVECLKGRGPQDVLQLVKALGQELLEVTGVKGRIEDPLGDGSALERFERMLLAQHADEGAARDLCRGAAREAFRRDHRPVNLTEIRYHGEGGFVSSIDPLTLGNIWKEEYSASDHNPHVGFLLLKIVGDPILSGDVWLQFHHQEKEIASHTLDALSKAIEVSKQKKKRKLIEKRVFMKEGKIMVEDWDENTFS